MALTIRDAIEAGHSAAMDVKQWQAEFVEEWLAPLKEREEARMREMAITAWMQLPDSVRAAMQQMDPARYAEMERVVNELKQGKNPANPNPDSLGGNYG